MKKALILIFTLISYVGFAGENISDNQTDESKQAEKYLDKITELTMAPTYFYDELFSSFFDLDSTLTKNLYYQFLKSIDSTLIVLADTPGFKGDRSMRDAALAYVSGLDTLAKNEIKVVVDWSIRTGLNPMEAIYTKSLMKDVVDKTAIIDNNLQDAKRDFANKHSITTSIYYDNENTGDITEEEVDKWIDEYEKLIDRAIILTKKANNGDAKASEELMRLSEEAMKLVEGAEKYGAAMNTEQQARLMKIAEKALQMME